MSAGEPAFGFPIAHLFQFPGIALAAKIGVTG
jgi:hypothetical protein